MNNNHNHNQIKNNNYKNNDIALLKIKLFFTKTTYKT